MRTYMQSKRFNGVFDPGINWHQELDVRINGGRPEYTDKKLKDLADDWVTCGVGNQCDIIPRDSNGAPCDFKLMRLGLDFNNTVAMEDWSKANGILNKIEARSQELIVDIRVGYLPVSTPLLLL
jgi:hypothetical protein